MAVRELDQACSTGDPLHVSVRALSDGHWEVLCDRIGSPLVKVNSREAAFEYAMLLALDHPPTSVELVG